MPISLRLSEEDAALIKNYAKLHGISISELVRTSVLEKIEDEYDLSAFRKAMEAYKKDGRTYTLNEAEKELGLS